MGLAGFWLIVSSEMGAAMNPERVSRIDRSGKSFQIGSTRAEDFPSLMEMYRHFSPRPGSQGLPPEDPEICHQWAKGLFEIAENLLAWRGDRVIGHAALVRDVRGNSGEFVIFVDQSQRDLGIGTELTRLALGRARELGFESLWLTVSLSNSIAIKLYRNAGFEFSDSQAFERIMLIQLAVAAEPGIPRVLPG